MSLCLDMNRVGKLFRLFSLLAVVAIVGACGGGSSEQFLDLAKKSRAEGNNGAAVIHLKNALQRNSQDAEARYLLGVIYNENLQGPSAESELRRANELGLIEGGRVMAELGRALLLQESYKKLLQEIKPAPAFEDSALVSIHALRGSAHLALNQIAEAKQAFDQALALQPEYVDALLGQARLAGGEKKLEEAARLIERAIASAPKSEDAWLLKGDLSHTTADRAGALAAYGKVLELNPKNIPARLTIASLEISGGNFDEARKQIDALRKVSPNSPMANHLHALLEFNQKNYVAARDAVQQVLKVAPDYIPSLLLAGVAEYRLGFQAQAQAHLERVIKHAPGNLYARKLLVLSLAKSGQAQRAIEVLQPGLTQAPEDVALIGFAGELYLQNNEFAKAEDYLAKAAKLNPQSASARIELGLSRMASGDADHRTLADLESAAQLDSDKFQADVLLVVLHLRRANYDLALKAVQTLEKKQPDNPMTYNLKATVYLAKKDSASARKQLERALELQPTYVPAAFNLAQLDLQDKNAGAARGRLEAVLKKDKDNVQALLALADFAPRIGATQKEAIDWLERASKASPGSALPQLMLARLYARAGDTKKAYTAAQQAQVINPDNPEVLDTLGASQMVAGEAKFALATYGKLVTLQPKSPVALYRLAGAQAAVANLAAAADTLKKALSLKPDFIEAQVTLGNLEIRAGHYPEAMKIARQVQKQTAKSPVGFVLEGDILMAEKKFLQAAKAYETAYGVGKSGLLAIGLHRAYALAGKPQAGDARLAQWLKESPNDAGVRLYAAEASRESGNLKNAIEQYEWVRQRQPDNPLVLNNLAWAYSQVKDPRALETAERAYKLQPDNAAVADTLGWMLVEQGNTKRGLELLQKAATAAPNAFEIRYHLAQGWLKAGDKSKARSELEQLLSTDAKFPQRPEAENLRKQLGN